MIKVLETRQGDGTYVTSLDPGLLLDAVSFVTHLLRDHQMLEVWEVRRLLEPAATALAAARMHRPRVLLLDEPTAGFDPQARREFHDVIHRLSEREGTTILLTTHDLDEAEKLSDRILILAGGKIVANGSAGQLAKDISDQAEVIWSQDGQQHIQRTSQVVAFTRTLLTQHPDGISDLEIRRASLEDTYMTIVQKYEKQRNPERGA